MSLELSLKVSTICGAKNVPANVPVNVSVKEHEGKNEGKLTVESGYLTVK